MSDSNSKHRFTTSFLQPLPYLVTPQGPENGQLTDSFFVGPHKWHQTTSGFSFTTVHGAYTSTNKSPNPNTEKGQKNAVYQDKTQHANFRGNPLYQATKRHLNNSYTVKNDDFFLYNETEIELLQPLICFQLSYVVYVSSAWKNVGITITDTKITYLNYNQISG